MNPWEDMAVELLPCYCNRTDGAHNAECPAYQRERVAAALGDEWARGTKLTMLKNPNPNAAVRYSQP